MRFPLGPEYLLAVKDNESSLHARLQRDFAYLHCTGTVAHDRCETVERGYGRLEQRTCTIMGGPNCCSCSRSARAVAPERLSVKMGSQPACSSASRCWSWVDTRA